ncbi:DNA cytosine methyltransferase [Dongia sedimenti]|uniref:DNA (cytosine-5-)-methyltransferase n=1 Tax=Dongia sedimenti TaxID=3064282 RepID=A0ABU0YU81_9PROT|nr:DNA cytosine methyltransferase [Rhodospirillaceae bacterium R-7]
MIARKVTRRRSASRRPAGATRKPTIRAVDFFCGVGGLTHGLSKGGVRVVAGIDIDDACQFPYEENNEARFINKDISDITASEVRKLLGRKSLTLLAGCAPCQPFSTYSRSARKAKAHADWSLVSAFGEIIKRVKPDYVTMENVPELADHRVFKKFLRMLDGYRIDWKIVECDEVGIPQTRSRLVLVAARKGEIKLKLPKVRKKATVRQAIEDLPRIVAGGSCTSDPLHTSSTLADINIKRIKASKPGGTWRDWPASLRAPCHRKKTGKTYSGVYGRMEWDKPAPTMTTQCYGFGNGRFGHPRQNRGISLREAAIIQSFPRRYAFVKKGDPISMKSLGRLIGNAVPVKLGKLIGATLVDHASRQRKKRKRAGRRAP